MLWAMIDGYPGASAFPPIGDYAFLSDCEVNALVAPSGAVEWLCLPRPDSPSVFGALLDRGAGTFRLEPTEVTVPAGRRYVPGTLVLETTWQTRSGWAIVRDALAMAPWYHDERRSQAWRRVPEDWEPEDMLLRTIRCVSGTIEINLTCEPAFDYGRTPGSWTYTGEGYHAAAVSPSEGEGPRLRLTTDLRLGIEGRSAKAQHRLHEGENAFVALAWGDVDPPTAYEDAADRMWRSGERWRVWLTQGVFPDHPWRVHLQRSALTLKGLSYAPTGALLAAATTSLPETPGGARNWDYRYSWVRDSAFALWGLYTLGFDAEADDFFAFLAEACRGGGSLQIMYGVGGETDLAEATLDHLDGYEGAKPVRIGNAAHDQAQHDVWGMVLDSVYLHTKSRDHLAEETWDLLVQQVEAAIERWQEPDHGIWEVRGEPRHFTTSKLMCWVATDRGARLAALRGERQRERRWREEAEAIRSELCERGTDERGVFVSHYDTDALDASVLLFPLVRFLPADDERIVATVRAVADELTEDGLVLRYRAAETDDGLGGAEEGAFTICSFWLVSALSEIGETDRARRLCERLLGMASALHLFAEELEPSTGRHLGNFPQAFTHLALINAVTHVIQDERNRAGQRFSPGRRTEV